MVSISLLCMSIHIVLLQLIEHLEFCFQRSFHKALCSVWGSPLAALALPLFSVVALFSVLEFTSAGSAKGTHSTLHCETKLLSLHRQQPSANELA